jgi:hypothetical protein
LQDIRAEEAKKDWTGSRAKHIQQLVEAKATVRRELDAIGAEMDDYYQDDGELLEVEEQIFLNLTRRSREKELGQIPLPNLT